MLLCLAKKGPSLFQLFQYILLPLIMVFTLSCSDSKPDRLLTSLSDDFNTSYIDTNRNIQINVYANFDDASQEEVSDVLLWSSSNEALATVKGGLITTNSDTGSVIIRYQTAEKKEDGSPLFEKTYQLYVKELQLQGITLSQTELLLYEGDTQSVQAKGIFEGDIELDITNDCEWSSADLTVSSVNNSDAKGLVIAIGEGATSITATNAGLSDSMDVVVKKREYKSIEIDNNVTSFNVEQSILLQVMAVGSDGSRVLLDPDTLNFVSSDVEVVSMSDNNATALSKGESTITVSLKSNSELTTSTLLTVEQDQYVRLFKNGVEVGLPFSDTQEYESFPEEYDSFSLKAVGIDSSVNNLQILDFNGIPLRINDGYFDGLNEGDVLSAGIEVPFKLVRTGSGKEFHFSFRVSDSFNNEFSQKYREN